MAERLQVSSELVVAAMRDALSQHEQTLLRMYVRRGPYATVKLYRQFNDVAALEQEIVRIRGKLERVLGGRSLRLRARLDSLSEEGEPLSGVPIKIRRREAGAASRETTPPVAPASLAPRPSVGLDGISTRAVGSPAEVPCPHGKLPAGSCWTCNPPPTRSFAEIEESRRSRVRPLVQGKERKVPMAGERSVAARERDGRVRGLVAHLGQATAGQLRSVLNDLDEKTIKNSLARLVERGEVEFVFASRDRRRRLYHLPGVTVEDIELGEPESATVSHSVETPSNGRVVSIADGAALVKFGSSTDRPAPTAGDDGVGDDRRGRYVEMLFDLAKSHPDQKHLFDRIERALGPAK